MHADLGRIVGSDHVERDVVVADASGLDGRAAALVRPATAEQVAEVVTWCYARGVAMVPVGGRTGYAGGCVPLRESVAVALDRLDRVRALDAGLWRMEAEAGVTTATVARRAREAGLLFPPDPGAGESSQLGGNVATNAGGPHAFKYGVTGAWVTGLEAVLAPGELVTVGGPVRKDVAGYDLRALLVGSEGTLGIVTAAHLRLVPAPELALPVLATYATVADGCAAIEAVLSSGVVPAAIEYLDRRALAASPPPHVGGETPAMAVVVEVDGTEDGARAAQAEVREALEEAGPLDLVVIDEPEVRAFWRWREGVSLGVRAARGEKLSEDVAVPVDRLGEAIEGVLEIGARHDLEACSWGHAGDGNLHATFLLDAGDEPQRARADDAAQELFALARELGGTVTGEHGIGVLKDGQLRHQWAPAAVEAHRAIKRALDPRDLFNPGKKLP
ncbi:MAG: FAD-binding protein [Solirubrobacterales bacterium]|nr:FAD-binding protein [Solirubrobacterales bacterium]